MRPAPTPPVMLVPERGFTNPAAGTYTITAGGTDIWGGSDNGSFIYDDSTTRAAGENFSAIVRSVSIAGDPAEALAGEWGRTGSMARKTPDLANSANAANIRKSGSANGFTVIQGRPNDGAGTDRGPGTTASSAILTPIPPMAQSATPRSGSPSTGSTVNGTGHGRTTSPGAQAPGAPQSSALARQTWPARSTSGLPTNPTTSTQ